MYSDKDALIKRYKSAAQSLADERAKSSEHRDEVIKERARFVERVGAGAGALVTVTVTFASRSPTSLRPHWLVKSLLIDSLWLVAFSVLYSLLTVKLAATLTQRDAVNSYQEALREMVESGAIKMSACTESDSDLIEGELQQTEAAAAEAKKRARLLEIISGTLATAVVLCSIGIFVMALTVIDVSF